MRFLHWCVFAVALMVLFIGFKNLIYLANANNITTTITQKILPGRISLSVPEFVIFPSIIGSLEKTQTSKTTLTGIHVFDGREDEDTSWVVTASSTDFYAINQPITINGENDTLVSDGVYNNPKGGVYTISIVKPGVVGQAFFSVRGRESFDNLLTGSNVAIGKSGLTVSFARAYYKLGDAWNLRADTIPISGLTIFPHNLSTNTSLQGISLGSMHTFTGNSDIATVLKADNTHVAGNFAVDLDLILLIPPFTYANKYTATLTITLD